MSVSNINIIIERIVSEPLVVVVLTTVVQHVRICCKIR